MKKLFSILFLATILISGCATNGENNVSQDKANEPNQDDKAPLKTKKIINGVAYSLSINEKNFNLDDEIIVNGVVKNVSSDPVNYIGYNGCDNGIGVSIPIPDYKSNFLEKDWDKKEARGCTEAIEHYVLEPGESIEERKVFISKMNAGKEKGMDVPAGEYKAKLTFQRVEIDSAAKHHQTILLALHVNGSKNILTEQEAENIGGQNETLKQWLSKRVGSAITKKENGDFYVMTEGKWQKAAEQFYNQMINYKPEYRIRFEDYEWIMTYVEKMQGPPHRIEIKIDAKNGLVKEVKKYDK